MNEYEINKLFNALDDNDNGLIEYSEFMTAIMSRELTYQSVNLKKAFTALDFNNDQTVDTAELHRGLS